MKRKPKFYWFLHLLVLTQFFFNSQDLDPTQFRRGVKLECVDFFRTSNLLDAPVPRQT